MRERERERERIENMKECLSLNIISPNSTKFVAILLQVLCAVRIHYKILLQK